MPTDTSALQHGATPGPLAVAYVPGVTPGKWIDRWQERKDRELRAFQCEESAALEELTSGRADLVFVRLPASGYTRPPGVNLIPLYDEQPVAAAAKEHPLAAFDAVELADLDGETIVDAEEMGGAAVALEVVAAGSGVVILPMSVARLYSRKDVTARPLGGVPATRIGIAWLQERDDDDIEEFVGVVRGRTANSSRQPSVLEEQKTTARQRTKARQSRAEGQPSAQGTGRAGGRGAGKTAGKNPGKAAGKSGAGGKGTKGGKPGKSGKPRRSR